MFARARSKKPLRAKRRKIVSAIEEVNFDFEARAEYLTGFHKRKLKRTNQAKEEAARKAKEERILVRKRLRDERRKEIERHVETINALLKVNSPKSIDGEVPEYEAWSGIQDDLPVGPIDHETEYSDEDRYTTVTVEDVRVSEEGLFKISGNGEGEIKANRKGEVISASNVGLEWRSKVAWPRKAKKFRYECRSGKIKFQGRPRATNTARIITRECND